MHVKQRDWEWLKIKQLHQAKKTRRKQYFSLDVWQENSNKSISRGKEGHFEKIKCHNEYV